MEVRELISKLKEADPDLPVYVLERGGRISIFDPEMIHVDVMTIYDPETRKCVEKKVLVFED